MCEMLLDIDMKKRRGQGQRPQAASQRLQNNEAGQALVVLQAVGVGSKSQRYTWPNQSRATGTAGLAAAVPLCFVAGCSSWKVEVKSLCDVDAVEHVAARGRRGQ